MERLRGFGPNGFSPEILRDITSHIEFGARPYMRQELGR